MNFKYFFLMIFIFLVSCVAKKTTIEYKEKTIRDTVNVKVFKTIIKPIEKKIIIENPCDSLGVLKSFDKEIQTELSSVRVYNDRGVIKAEINIDSLKQVFYSEFQTKYQSKTEIKEVEIIKFKYPLWLILTAFFSLVLNVLFIKIKI